MKLLLPLLLGSRFGQAGANHMVGFRDELFLPVLDLIGMPVKMLSQLGESPVARTAANAILALNAGA